MFFCPGPVGDFGGAVGPREWLRGALSGRRISRARWDMRLDVARAPGVSRGSPTRSPWLINVIKII